jgi:hypothetical protein
VQLGADNYFFIYKMSLKQEYNKTNSIFFGLFTFNFIAIQRFSREANQETKTSINLFFNFFYLIKYRCQKNKNQKSKKEKIEKKLGRPRKTDCCAAALTRQNRAGCRCFCRVRRCARADAG